MSKGLDGPPVETPSPSESTKPQANGADPEAFAAAHAVDPMALGFVLGRRQEHPDWSAARIAKDLGLPKSLVELVLREFPE
jgi:hypothetical protein